MRDLTKRTARVGTVSTLEARELDLRLGPAEAQYGPQTLTLVPEGSNGVIACGATILDQGVDDLDPGLLGNAAIRFRWVDLANETGYRHQLDGNSAVFVVEDVGGEFGANTTTWLTSQGSSVTHTYRLIGHVGHAPGHGGTPIAGDVVSNECTLTWLIGGD